MSTQTSNLNLTKQANNENWSNDIHNANLDKIDGFAGTLKATTLASGTNFNDLTVPNTGAHVLYNGSNISQMTNVPTEVASQAWPFLVECFKVGAGGSGYYTRQILHVYATTGSPVNIFVRSQSYIGSGTGWLGWEKLVSNSQIGDIAQTSKQYSNNGTTWTFSLRTGGCYLVAINKLNTSDANYGSGLYMVQAHNGAGSVRTIAAATGATVSINKTTLTVTTTTTYTGVSVICLGLW